MYTVNDILARLKNGEAPEAIGDEIAQSLNDAIAAYEAEKAEAAAKAQEAEKIQELQEILDDLTHWAAKYYGADATASLHMDAADIIKTIDSTVKELEELMTVFDIPTEKAATHECKCGGKCQKSGSKITAKGDLNDFIAKMGW